MGYFLSSAFNSETAAVAFAPIINMPLTLLGGYMINLESIKGKFPQAIVEWVQYLSPVRYSFNGVMQLQWNNVCSKYWDFVKNHPDVCGTAGDCTEANIVDWLNTKFPTEDWTVENFENNYPVLACGIYNPQSGEVDGGLINFYGTKLSFWTCAAGLFILWLFFRAAVVVSLTLQDAHCEIGTDQNDTRNVSLKTK